jgi:hypothetical protein
MHSKQEPKDISDWLSLPHIHPANGGDIAKILFHLQYYTLPNGRLISTEKGPSQQTQLNCLLLHNRATHEYILLKDNFWGDTTIKVATIDFKTAEGIAHFRTLVKLISTEIPIRA